jgi:hypothetical protein
MQLRDLFDGVKLLSAIGTQAVEIYANLRPSAIEKARRVRVNSCPFAVVFNCCRRNVFVDQRPPK